MNSSDLARLDSFVFRILNSVSEKSARKIFLEGIVSLVPCAVITAPMCRKSDSGSLEFFDYMGIGLNEKLFHTYSEKTDKEVTNYFLANRNGDFAGRDSEFFSEQMRVYIPVYRYMKENDYGFSMSYNTAFFRKKCVSGNLVRKAGEPEFSDEEVSVVNFLVHALSLRLRNGSGLRNDAPLETAKDPDFSRQQRQVYELLIKGCSVKEISSALNISESTVKYHSKNIYTICGVDSKARLIAQSRETAALSGQ